MSSALSVRITRTAISPRFATSTDSNIRDLRRQAGGRGLQLVRRYDAVDHPELERAAGVDALVGQIEVHRAAVPDVARQEVRAAAVGIRRDARVAQREHG